MSSPPKQTTAGVASVARVVYADGPGAAIIVDYAACDVLKLGSLTSKYLWLCIR